MATHALALEETIVVDDPDAEAITMHVLIDGERHRRLPDLSHTACALRIQSQFYRVLPEELAGRLCVLCFTAFEISQAKGSRR